MPGTYRVFSPSKSFGRKGWSCGVVRCCWSRRSPVPCMAQTEEELLPVVVLVLPNKELDDEMFVPHMSPAELVFAKPWEDPVRADDEEVIPLLEGVLPRVGVSAMLRSPMLDMKLAASTSGMVMACIVVFPSGQLFKAFWAYK